MGAEILVIFTRVSNQGSIISLGSDFILLFTKKPRALRFEFGANIVKNEPKFAIKENILFVL